MMITHNSLCSSLERMNRKWAALASIHYSLSTVLLHVNNLCSDTAKPLFPLSLFHSLFLSHQVTPSFHLIYDQRARYSRACKTLKHPTKHFIIQLHLLKEYDPTLTFQ